MSEVFEVYILSSNVRTCFFYLNDQDLRSIKHHDGAIKIQFGPNRENLTYGSLKLTGVSEVPSKCIGISSLLANNLGLKENDIVLVSNCSPDSLESLEIVPKREEDYVILLSCKNILETYLLDQVSVVAEGQILPLYVFSNISIDVEIGAVDSKAGYGQLKKFTEIKVLHPLERSKNLLKAEVKPEKNTAKKTDNINEYLFNELQNALKNRINLNQISKLKSGETFLKHLSENNISKSLEYKIQPPFLFSDDVPQNIRNKFIIVSNFESFGNTFGPYSLKVLAKVTKVGHNVENTHETDEKKKESNFFYSYVISLNSDKKNIAFCPKDVMKKLKIFVGSKIKIERVQSKSKIELFRCSEKIKFNDKIEFYSKNISDMKENVKKTVMNNMKYNYKVNCLILGEPGTGKTYFLKDIESEFSDQFIFCKIIDCKSLRGKKIEKLDKLLTEIIKECSNQQPSLLILDDLHVLTKFIEEENQFNRLYSERVVDLICDLLEDYQEKYNISVIASAVNKAQLSSFISRYGSPLFQNVLPILSINFNERILAIKTLLNNKLGTSKEFSLNFEMISSGTNGYTIQDLSDLVDKAVFNYQLRGESVFHSIDISQEDFDKALSDTIPLNLKNVKLKENPDIKWENVGGMIEAKKTLLEVFSWPVKYPHLLESCPLRLQRGALLYGAPGTGKTLLAGALANKCGLKFISVKGPEILSKYVGASEEGVRSLFFQAEKTQPCLLFFDEFDSLAPKRGNDNTGVTDRVVNQLLTELDGVEARNGVWVLAATSRPDLLDPALLRPGRLDKMVYCDVPTQIDRELILKALSQNLPKSEDVDFSEIARKSNGYTGADLQAVLYNAQMTAIKEEKNKLQENLQFKVKQSHLLKALSEVKPSLSQRESEKYKTIYEKFLNSRKKNASQSFDGVQKLTFA